MTRTIPATAPHSAAEATPAYFTPDQSTRAPRPLTALEQMFGYYTAD